MSRLGTVKGNRWLQLVLYILCMVTIANLQYGWTLFVGPMDAAHHWGKPQIQVAFTIFVIAETWLLPVLGWIVDRSGPRLATIAAGGLVGLSWVLNSLADSLAVLYVAAAIGGLGAGVIYGAAVGGASKWFPDKRGLASGLTAAGFGAGSALTLVPISQWIADYGYASAFFWFGLAQGVLVIIVALFLTPPPARAVTYDETDKSNATPLQVLRSPVFWVMYAMFVLVASGGLMATAQLSVIATDFGVAKTPATLLGVTLPALTYALSIDRLLNGLTRPFFGWVSDQIGRENTMFIAFGLEALGIYTLMAFAHDPVLFVVFSGLVFFAWGEIYSLFPATCTDTFGAKNATANYGLLYTAKGTAALLVPLSSLIQEQTGGWTKIFEFAIIFNILAAVLALGVLKPLRRSAMRAFAPAVAE